MKTGLQNFFKQSFLSETSDTGSLHPHTEIPKASDRMYWVDILTRIVSPVLDALSENRLKEKMRVETVPGAKIRKNFSHLEAVSRSLMGMAPWLELDADETKEGVLRARFIESSLAAIKNAVDPAAPDYLNFTAGNQSLVEAAFLAQAFIRAPKHLWSTLDETTRQRVVTALTSTRTITPPYTNWLLFPAMIEVALLKFGLACEPDRIRYALQEHEKWYAGDGFYSDGPKFRFDYYNSFVIQPMLIDIVQTVYDKTGEMGEMLQQIHKRASRYSIIQERLIAPDGSFPPVGRSLAYRCGAFQLLAQLALYNRLPDSLPPNQVRSALTAVITRTLEATETFDQQGWLHIGLAGHQPELAEHYISTGSLYLCTAAFLPLGLPADDKFWTAPACDWTSKRVFEGRSIRPDKALDS